MSPQSDQRDRIQAARDSYSGKSLTNSQLQSAWAISSILHSQIQKTGSFREPLTDYAHAFARGERFDALRAETILRDIYTARYEQSLNQTRESQGRTLYEVGKDYEDAYHRPAKEAEIAARKAEQLQTRPQERQRTR